MPQQFFSLTLSRFLNDITEVPETIAEDNGALCNDARVDDRGWEEYGKILIPLYEAATFYRVIEKKKDETDKALALPLFSHRNYYAISRICCQYILVTSHPLLSHNISLSPIFPL